MYVIRGFDDFRKLLTGFVEQIKIQSRASFGDEDFKRGYLAAIRDVSYALDQWEQQTPRKSGEIT
jgi:hypothetical protein